MDDLSVMAYEMRKDVLDMICRAGTGHIGGDFSVMEILTDLYFRQMNISPELMDDRDRDRFVLSKGHSVESYYAVLARKGFFDIEEVKARFSAFNSPYIGHPNNKLPGIEMNSGSLGHGISVGVGMALAARMNHQSYRTYVVLGDGEMAEGSNYEGMMAAGHYKLDNLCATVDLNRLQISGTTGQVMDSASLADKFRDFGWNVIEVLDGNDCAQLVNAYEQAAAYKGKPTAVIASTVKGKGVSFMENQISWHHGVMTEEQYEQAVKELKEALQ